MVSKNSLVFLGRVNSLRNHREDPRVILGNRFEEFGMHLVASVELLDFLDERLEGAACEELDLIGHLEGAACVRGNDTCHLLDVI